MLDPKVREILTRVIGVSEEDLPKVAERTKRILGMVSAFRPYHIVAEVTEAKYCFAGLKEGQKIVFGCLPFSLDAGQTDCPLCLRALKPVMEPVTVLREFLMAGADPTRIEPRGAECMDPGLDRGGLGHVSFRIYVRKVE